MLKYFAYTDRVIHLDELLIKFKRCSDRGIILNVAFYLEEYALIDVVPDMEAWIISDYGRLIHSKPIERLIKI